MNPCPQPGHIAQLTEHPDPAWRALEGGLELVRITLPQPPPGGTIGNRMEQENRQKRARLIENLRDSWERYMVDVRALAAHIAQYDHDGERKE